MVPNSPAARAGLRPEDLIVALDDVALADVGDLQRLMVAELIGSKVIATVVRDGELHTVELVPVELET